MGLQTVITNDDRQALDANVRAIERLTGLVLSGPDDDVERQAVDLMKLAGKGKFRERERMKATELCDRHQVN